MKPHLLALLGLVACTGQAADSDLDDDSAEARAQRKLVFATSEGYRGDQLGGLDSADAIHDHSLNAASPGLDKALTVTPQPLALFAARYA
jgi:hypothetical protein